MMKEEGIGRHFDSDDDFLEVKDADFYTEMVRSLHDHWSK